MNLHTVKACALRIVSPVTERLHDTVNLLHRQRPAGLVKPPVRNLRRCHRRKFPQIRGNRHTPEAARHHQEDLTAVGVHPLRHLPSRADKVHRIVGGIGAVRHTRLLHLTVGKGNPGNDQAGASLCPLHIVINAPLVKSALRVRKPQRPHRRHGKAVLDGERTDLHRCKKFLIHAVTLLFVIFSTLMRSHGLCSKCKDLG